MKLETILDAMVKANSRWHWAETIELTDRRHRQYHTFRDRILAMDAEKDRIIEVKTKSLKVHQQVVSEQDKRIAELEGIVKDLEEEVDGLLIQQIGDWDGRA